MQGNVILTNNGRMMITTSKEFLEKKEYKTFIVVNGVEFYGFGFKDGVRYSSVEGNRKAITQTLRDEAKAMGEEAQSLFNEMMMEFGSVDDKVQGRVEKQVVEATKQIKEEVDIEMRWQDIVAQSLMTVSKDKIVEDIIPIIVERLEKELGFVAKDKIVIEYGEKLAEMNDIFHEKFETVLKIMGAKKAVYLTGEAGSGKNVIAEQVAKALSLEFYFTNAVTQEYKLTGFIDGYGKYHETAFYKAFTEGGVFFLDEMDASIPEALIILNGAIANGYFDFPNGKAYAHPDFRVISAGNTYGTGADNVYNGRYQLDGATLNRFIPIEIDYSPRIEEALTKDKDILEFVRSFRKISKEIGVHHILSYRNISQLDELIQIGIDGVDAVKMVIKKELGKDDVNIFVDRLKKVIPSNKILGWLQQC